MIDPRIQKLVQEIKDDLATNSFVIDFTDREIASALMDISISHLLLDEKLTKEQILAILSESIDNLINNDRNKERLN